RQATTRLTAAEICTARRRRVVPLAEEPSSSWEPVATIPSSNLYGTTSAGGAAGLGNVFKVAPDGTFTSLHEFMQAEGAAPMGSLVRDASGTLFGTTSRGGALDLGT